MIQEIVNFIKNLENKSPEVFSENIELKDGMYFFLEKENDTFTIKEENTLKVDKKTEKSGLYNQFLDRYSNSEMITNKSMNASEKIFIDIGSPFGISISGKGQKIEKAKKLQAAEAYFKAVQKYLGNENEQYIKWFDDLKNFVRNQMFDFLNGNEDFQKPKDNFMFYFFLKEPEIKDYQFFYNKYLATKVFLFDLKKDENHGISNDLNVGNVGKKPFMRHKSASFEINYKVNGDDATGLYKFFRLQQENKILPNPMPIFVDENELSNLAIKFYNSDKEKKKSHKEIIENLLTEHKNELHNYYLIYFQNNLKGCRIIDIDFVPVFRYKTDDMPKIIALFKMKSKDKTEHINDYSIQNIFDFQSNILNKVFNKQLMQETKNGLWLKYFDDMEVSKYASETIVILFYKYRKAMYDYVYKSKRQSITYEIFNDIMQNSIIDDIRNDKEYNKTFIIKEKLNIWFSLFNYFVNSPSNINTMVNKTELLFEKISRIAKNNNERMQTDDEFAFASGQLIRNILNKSESADRTHALLDPFLQKTDPTLFKLAIAKAFETYKHAFQFYKGNSRYEFDKIMSEVMGFETDEKNMKNLLPLLLAGYFADTIFRKDEKIENEL